MFPASPPREKGDAERLARLKLRNTPAQGRPLPPLVRAGRCQRTTSPEKPTSSGKGTKHESPSLASQTAGPSHSRFAIWRPGVAAGGFLVIHTRRRRQASRHAPRVSICRHACEAARARLGLISPSESSCACRRAASPLRLSKGKAPSAAGRLITVASVKSQRGWPLEMRRRNTAQGAHTLRRIGAGIVEAAAACR